MSIRKTALLICDLQQQTISQLYYKPLIIKNTNKLLHMKQYIPQLCFSAISEFIPHKLSNTVHSIDKRNVDLIYTKTSYSMVNDELISNLHDRGITDVILTGMETQWCINKTLEDLTYYKYKTYVPVDCIGNRLSNEENTYNLHHLKNNGALLTTTDASICSFLNEYTDEASKEYLKLLKSCNKK